MFKPGDMVPRGSLLEPNGMETVTYEEARDLRKEGIKAGRWIYCKYCYASTKPLLCGIFQIVCSRCGYGLTPDCETAEALQKFLIDGEYPEPSGNPLPKIVTYQRTFYHLPRKRRLQLHGVPETIQ
jgi:hypothetical protein